MPDKQKLKSENLVKFYKTTRRHILSLVPVYVELLAQYWQHLISEEALTYRRTFATKQKPAEAFSGGFV
jgi:hypothetical protein